MNKKVDYTKKRLRYSSSETDTPKPVAKQQRSNMATGGVNNGADTSTGSGTDHGDSQSQVLSLLKALQAGQDQLRSSLMQQMNDMKTELKGIIDKKFIELRKNVESEMKAMSSDIARVAARVDELERARNNPQQLDNAQGNRMIVIKNLPEILSENPAKLLEEFNSMVTAMGLELGAVRATELERVNRGAPGKPKSVLVTLESQHMRSLIMKNKRKLRGEQAPYNNVFIDPWQHKQERFLQANLRHIAKAVPSLEYRGGRLVNK
jgi:hypothetical protein